ncbi:MAG: DNA/RNA nuclease SfsA [candidate division KSB1 bacterium]|nr:DNA/RNA nuclease SfsA [candidate division KSB1 bacterium]
MQLPPLTSGTLIRRYKRFLADIELDGKERITAFTPNTGSMKGCSEPGSRVRLSKSDNPRRKYPYTLELVQSGSTWVGVNTGRANLLVREAIESGLFPSLTDYEQIRSEVKTGFNSRIDLLLKTGPRLCYVEVKNVTLVENKTAFFPDAVTSRGTKHLNELIGQVQQGHRAVMVYTVQRNDAERFSPAFFIDPVYTKTLNTAIEAGVEVIAAEAAITGTAITLERELPMDLRPQL